MKVCKYKCSCGNIWYGMDEDIKIVECDLDEDDEDGADHIVKKIKRLQADDYVIIWENELEDANRHSLTDMPETIHDTLKKHVKDKALLTRIMKELYEREIGI